MNKKYHINPPYRTTILLCQNILPQTPQRLPSYTSILTDKPIVDNNLFNWDKLYFNVFSVNNHRL